ncbi:MAG: TonB-dependent receptor [Saprospiraceae bacterium]|nr:TonB-dependent receptor [Saprospiraceae bacterium]
MIRASLLAAIIAFFMTPGFAQSVETVLKGSIKDENNEPIGYANIGVFTELDSVMAKAGYSGEDGSFLFSYLSPGTYYLNVAFVGFETYTSQPFTLTANQETVLGQIHLTYSTTELGEVVVSSTKPVIEVKPDKTVFNIEGSINATGNNALELLRKAPGVIVDNNERLMLAGKSGVRVYIDGKQSILTGDDLANYLKTLQSTQIEAIEIITQPSARYEAEGNAGIINIRLLKDKSLGTNALVSLGHNQATHGETNVNVNLNTRTEKLNVFGNINYSSGASSEYSNFERTTSDLYATQSTTGINSWDNISLRTGLDVTTGTNSTIGILFDGYRNENPTQHDISSILYPEEGAPPSSFLHGRNSVDQLRENYNFNTNYRMDNKNGTVLNIDLDYGLYSSDGNSYQPNYYYDPSTGELTDTRIFSSNTFTTIDIKTMKLDYELPLWGGTVGTGFKLALVNTDNTFEFYDIIDGTPVLNTDQTNTFEYEENVNAGYLSYQKQWKKIGLQAGTRIEHTASKGELTSLNSENGETVSQDYVDLFPSGGISYQLNPKNAFSLNYSRRIDRPGYQDLNPFEYKLDELTYQKGNPFLKPQYSNNIQLSHTFNYTLNTTLSYSHTNDLMAPLTDTASNGAAFLTTENIADQDVFSFGISYPFSVAKWWNVFVNTGVADTHNEADFGEGKVIDISATTFNLYAQNSYILPKNFTFELSGWYNSPGIWGGNFASAEMWSIDAGIQKKIWQDRGTLKISVSDIFKTQAWAGENSFGDLAMKANGGWESRQLRINFTYSLGNTNVIEQRKRTTGLQDEAKRIK